MISHNIHLKIEVCSELQGPKGGRNYFCWIGKKLSEHERRAGACKAENRRKGIPGRKNGMMKGSEAHCLEWPITGEAQTWCSGRRAERNFASGRSGKLF